jgi:tRNA-2-methylthio-N6-dimethylallyladenosine synthase
LILFLIIDILYKNNFKGKTFMNIDRMDSYIENIKKKNTIKEYSKDRLNTYYIETFGCQMNENDSEKLAGMLEKMGYTKTDKKTDSTLIVFNTCCVREHAEEKVFGHLGALKGYKEENPDVIIAVCGCMMQQKKVAEYIHKTYKHIGIIFGTYNLYKLPEYVYQVLEYDKRVLDVWSSEGKVWEGFEFKRNDEIKAWVTIMYGCNNFCTYCIVPYVRGRERSRNVNEILDEIKILVNKGYKEITLLGQNVNSFGKDLEDDINFAKLLYLINDIKGIKRVRFLTSHPKDLSDELIDAIKNCDNVCNSLHLPVQAGSSKVLKEMNRVYKKEDYLNLVYKVKEKIPDISLTTDIIVGFPGETDEDFEDTLDIVKKAKFDSAFTFLYSKRTGTKAALREDQIDSEIKKKRFNKLLEIQNSISNEINQNYLNKKVKVLVEGYSKNNKSVLTGRTESNKVVNFQAGDDVIGKIVEVKINSIKTWSLSGSIV